MAVGGCLKQTFRRIEKMGHAPHFILLLQPISF